MACAPTCAMRSTLAGTPADIKAAFTAKFGDEWEALLDAAHKHHTACVAMGVARALYNKLTAEKRTSCVCVRACVVL